MDDLMTIYYIIGGVVGGLIWGAVSIAIIRSKGYEAKPFSSWFWDGFFLGIIGVIVAAVKPENPNKSN